MCIRDRSVSTLNRLELTNAKTSGDVPSMGVHKIVANHEVIERLLVRLAVSRLAEDTEEVVLDFDATDSLIHGDHEGRFFHGYYRNHCFLPLYYFIGTYFNEFNYQTAKSWSRTRRVIGKAQVNPKGENPRFVVTNLPGASVGNLNRSIESSIVREEIWNRSEAEIDCRRQPEGGAKRIRRRETIFGVQV